MTGTGPVEHPTSLTVKCPVTVKVRVTERWKLRMAGELQETLRRTEQELLQLEGQLRRLQRVGEQAAGEPGAGEPTVREQGAGRDHAAWREHVQNEVRRRQERRSQILGQLRQLARLEPGSEVVQGQVEGLARIRVGDRWDQVVGAELILEDGVVVEIRTAREAGGA